MFLKPKESHIERNTLPDKVFLGSASLDDSKLTDLLEELFKGTEDEKLLSNFNNFLSQNDETKRVILGQMREKITEGTSYTELYKFFTEIIEFLEMSLKNNESIEPMSAYEAEQLKRDSEAQANYEQSLDPDKGKRVN